MTATERTCVRGSAAAETVARRPATTTTRRFLSSQLWPAVVALVGAFAFSFPSRAQSPDRRDALRTQLASLEVPARLSDRLSSAKGFRLELQKQPLETDAQKAARKHAAADPGWLLIASRSVLGSKLDPGLVALQHDYEGVGRCAFHERGDSDTLFTLPAARAGRARVAAAIEVNDVIPRALVPWAIACVDGPRPAGDYQPVDALGHPRQARIAARVSW